MAAVAVNELTRFDTCATARGGSDRRGDRIRAARGDGFAPPHGDKSSKKQIVALF
jgi:hypothetical protein